MDETNKALRTLARLIEEQSLSLAQRRVFRLAYGDLAFKLAAERKARKP